jgi:hypothetical protein
MRSLSLEDYIIKFGFPNVACTMFNKALLSIALGIVRSFCAKSLL